VFFLSDKIEFPEVHFADQNGMLAVGGDLTIPRLKLAYESGIFPWYSSGEPI
jgi:leucyl/phenylalanyl-tRNA--protein transferase